MRRFTVIEIVYINVFSSNASLFLERLSTKFHKRNSPFDVFILNESITIILFYHFICVIEVLLHFMHHYSGAVAILRWKMNTEPGLLDDFLDAFECQGIEKHSRVKIYSF